jgi:putative MATE family efflux protein
MDVSSAVTARSGPGFWSSVREALAGSHQDFTEGSLGRAILLLAIPMVLEMVMESLFGIVDIFFVAHLGADAVTIAGLTEGMLTILFAIAMGLAMASTAMVARRVGEKDFDGAADSAVQSIGLGVLVSLIVGVIGIVFAPDLLRLMGGSPAVVRGGARYTATMLGGSFVIVMLFLNNAIFRGAGDAAIAMRVLWVANAINIVLDPCLILGLGPFPKLGVNGAAVSTTIGRGIGVAYQFWYLFGGKLRVRILARHVKIHWDVLRRLVRIAANGAFQNLVAMASWLALVRLNASFGSNAVAGYTIAIRIIIFALLPAWGLTNAAATLVGQNLGAQKPDRAESAVWRTGFFNMCFLGAVGLTFIAFPHQVIGVFTNDPGVQAYAVNCLRIVSCGYISFSWGMVVIQAFNGAGDTWTPTLLNLFCCWVWQIPLAYTLAIGLGFGPKGIYSAIAIADTSLAVVGIWAFRRGKWKLQKV